MKGARAGSINIPVGIGELLLVDFLRAMELGDGAYIERKFSVTYSREMFQTD